ncbi:hypothetical protein DDT46_13715 [Mycobacteroides abscessus]|uniref:hypothetical protein n=1 Tax=Mycobacteroides abscessus TaxID=36809 RepID=UPI000C267D61|nr:hypothetical protein [Mycobacteroides abscessus]AWG64747.1 hypothetical protein DDT46_13715 [Mycobacteroides abscessus]RIS83585.1 hypothetical protein D2E44_10535 [Mycobacteroides abscessus]
MLLCFVFSVVLFQFFWFAGLNLGFWITVGGSVILAIVAVAHRVWFNERLYCWHAVLAGLCSLTWFVAVDAAAGYGL